MKADLKFVLRKLGKEETLYELLIFVLHSRTLGTLQKVYQNIGYEVKYILTPFQCTICKVHTHLNFHKTTL